MAYQAEGESTPRLRDWYLKQNSEVQAEFDSALNILAGSWKLEEQVKLFKDLHEQHSGLSEIKFKVGNRKYRPVGFRLSQPQWNEKGQLIEGHFGIILGCTKSGYIYDPLNAFDFAKDLKDQYCIHGKGNFNELDF